MGKYGIQTRYKEMRIILDSNTTRKVKFAI